MGIRGLRTFIQRTLAQKELTNPTTDIEIPYGSTLLIDGYGLLYYLLERTITFDTFNREYQSNYMILDKIVKDIISEWMLNTNGMVFKIYFDGPSAMKSDCYGKRSEQRAETWRLFHDAINDCSVDSMNQKNIPVPPLAMAQMKHTICSIDGLQIIECATEADSILANDCYLHNKDKRIYGLIDSGNGDNDKLEMCYVLGNDSDFLAFADTAYIEFDQFDFITGVASKIWRRCDTAAALDMTECHFREMCILIGNDYTSHFSRSLYSKIDVADTEGGIEIDVEAETEELNPDGEEEEVDVCTEDCTVVTVENQYSFKCCRKLKAQVQRLPCDAVLSSNDAMLQQAILFSRALYDLKDTSEYESQPADDASESEDQVMKLTKVQKSEIDEFLHSQLISGGTQAVRITDPVRFCSVFNTICMQIESIYSALPCDFNDSVYQRALHTMAMRLCEMFENDYEIQDVYEESNSVKQMRLRPTWNDIVIGNYYQLIYSRYQSVLGRNEIPVKYMFNGSMFHMLLHQCRAESAVSAICSTPTPIVTSAADAGSSSKRGKAEAVSSFIRKEVKRVDDTGTSIETAVVASAAVAYEQLPIDQHKELLLNKINSDRVIIIHGETGCGKSSRLPVILHDDAAAHNRPCKMMISQPRRIAAVTLMKRVRGILGNKVGMRMGHGIKDEHPETVMWFVTTGYIVRLLAHHPESFQDHTHLIIDEVHERSIDGDVLCLLARRLLAINPSIKIILMSATIHTDLYRTYFTSKVDDYGDMECISVGVRRFPVEIMYLDDLAVSPEYSMLSKLSTGLLKLTSNCKGSYDEQVPVEMAKKQYEIAVSLIRKVGVNGTGCLVFVSGIGDIVELKEKFENLPRYKVFVIHSDIPFEEQEAAFLPTGSDEVKVVLATNAAESSITLPDVDVVICLATHKSMSYSVSNHRAQLANSWISKASSTQRAGRTGRTRPGKVFRLYGRRLYDKFQEHDTSEVLRTPMQDVILSMRAMFESSHNFDGVVPILESLLEPPDVENVKKSFDYLHLISMITSPDDNGQLTALGRFAGQMPLDLQLSRLVAYGIALGVGLEAAIMAAALVQPKPLFRIASTLVHTDPDEFNDITLTTFLGALNLDSGTYSEPIMYLIAFIEWNSVKDSYRNRDDWMYQHGLVKMRFRHFIDTASNLIERVRTALKGGNSKYYSKRNLMIDDMMRDGSSLKRSDLTLDVMNRLRLLLTWSSDGNIIKMKPQPKLQIDPMLASQIIINDPIITKAHVTPLFPDYVSWELELLSTRIFDARFSASRLNADRNALLLDFISCVSASDTVVPLLWVNDQACDAIFIIAGDVDELHAKILDIFPTESLSQYALLSIFPMEVLAERQLVQMAKHTLFLCPKPSNKMLNKISGMQETVSATLVLNITVKGNNPKLICRNFIPMKELIARVFFADDEHHYHDSINRNTSGRNAYRISEQVLGTKQSIKFNEEGVDKSYNLIDDLPVGYRIINSLRLGYRKKKFLLRKVPRNGYGDTVTADKGNRTPTSTSLKASPASEAKKADSASKLMAPVKVLLKSKAAIPGTKEWSQTKPSAAASTTTTTTTTTSGTITTVTATTPSSDDVSAYDVSVRSPYSKSSPTSSMYPGYGDAEVNDEKIEINTGVDTITPGWSFYACKAGQDTGRSLMANQLVVLPRQSIHNVAVHCGPQSLYGIAHTVLDIVTGSGTHMMALEKITFLPIGSRWIHMAMRCIDMDVSFTKYDDKQRNNELEVTEDEVQECRHINGLLNDVCNYSVLLNQELVNRVNELFASYIEQQHSNATRVNGSNGTGGTKKAFPATPNTHSTTAGTTSTPTGTTSTTAGKGASGGIHLCDYCNRKFKSEVALHEHFRAQHLEVDDGFNRGPLAIGHKAKASTVPKEENSSARKDPKTDKVSIGTINSTNINLLLKPLNQTRDEIDCSDDDDDDDYYEFDSDYEYGTDSGYGFDCMLDFDFDMAHGDDYDLDFGGMSLRRMHASGGGTVSKKSKKSSKSNSSSSSTGTRITCTSTAAAAAAAADSIARSAATGTVTTIATAAGSNTSTAAATTGTTTTGTAGSKNTNDINITEKSATTVVATAAATSATISATVAATATGSKKSNKKKKKKKNSKKSDTDMQATDTATIGSTTTADTTATTATAAVNATGNKKANKKNDSNSTGQTVTGTTATADTTATANSTGMESLVYLCRDAVISIRDEKARQLYDPSEMFFSVKDVMHRVGHGYDIVQVKEVLVEAVSLGYLLRHSKNMFQINSP